MNSWAKDLTDRDIVEMMIYIDSEGFTKGLSIKWHPSKWYALESILRERHGDNWYQALRETA